jgi:hypothetical protein
MNLENEAHGVQGDPATARTRMCCHRAMSQHSLALQAVLLKQASFSRPRFPKVIALLVVVLIFGGVVFLIEKYLVYFALLTLLQ